MPPPTGDDLELLAAAREWLIAGGYQLIEHSDRSNLAQGLDIFQGDALTIRITADRGQWFIEAHPAGGDRWFTLESWSACMGAPTLFHDPRPRTSDADWADRIAQSWKLEPQLTYLRGHLPQMEAICNSPERTALEACLAGG